MNTPRGLTHLPLVDQVRLRLAQIAYAHGVDVMDDPQFHHLCRELAVALDLGCLVTIERNPDSVRGFDIYVRPPATV